MCRIVVSGEQQVLLIKAFHKSVHNAAFHVGLRHTWCFEKEHNLPSVSSISLLQKAAFLCVVTSADDTFWGRKQSRYVFLIAVDASYPQPFVRA